MSSSSRVHVLDQEVTTIYAARSCGCSRTWSTGEGLYALRYNRRHVDRDTNERRSSLMQPTPGACSRSPKPLLIGAEPSGVAESTISYSPFSMAWDCAWVKCAACASKMSTRIEEYSLSGGANSIKVGWFRWEPSWE